MENVVDSPMLQHLCGLGILKASRVAFDNPDIFNEVKGRRFDCAYRGLLLDPAQRAGMLIRRSVMRSKS
jgi:hypothetical protein